VGLGIALQITVGPALKRREMKLIKRQLEDMSVIEGSVDNRKARERSREGGSSS
jgi:cell division septation protein DedD